LFYHNKNNLLFNLSSDLSKARNNKEMSSDLKLFDAFPLFDLIFDKCDLFHHTKVLIVLKMLLG